MEWIPKTGERYKDDADNMYQIIAVAVHAETEERMVVYQEMFGEFGIYARAVQQFTGENGCRRMFTKADRKTDQKADLKTDQTVDTRSDGTTDQPVQVRKENQSLQPAGSRQAGRPVSETKQQFRLRTQSPAESRRALRQNVSETSGEGAYYYEKRRRQMEEREQRRELFRKSERHESATEELRANPCLIKFLEADTYEQKYHVLNEIQNDITDRLIDDIAVVLDVVIPEGALADRFHQLRNIILTRQKYETNRFR